MHALALATRNSIYLNRYWIYEFDVKHNRLIRNCTALLLNYFCRFLLWTLSITKNIPFFVLFLFLLCLEVLIHFTYFSKLCIFIVYFFYNSILQHTLGHTQFFCFKFNVHFLSRSLHHARTCGHFHTVAFIYKLNWYSFHDFSHLSSSPFLAYFSAVHAVHSINRWITSKFRSVVEHVLCLGLIGSFIPVQILRSLRWRSLVFPRVDRSSCTAVNRDDWNMYAIVVTTSLCQPFRCSIAVVHLSPSIPKRQKI